MWRLMGLTTSKKTSLHKLHRPEDLRSRTQCLETRLMLDDIIRRARPDYEPLLPRVTSQFRELDSRIHIGEAAQRHLAETLQGHVTAPRTGFGHGEEQIDGESIA